MSSSSKPTKRRYLRLKRSILLLLVAVFSVIAPLATLSSSAFALNNPGYTEKAAKMSPDQQSKAYAYYKFIRQCFSYETFSSNAGFGINNWISVENSNTFNWFKSNIGAAGTSTAKVGLVNVDDIGKPQSYESVEDCHGDTFKTIMGKAAPLFGYTGDTAGSQILCDLGFTPEVGGTCARVDTGWRYNIPSNLTGRVDDWFKDKIGFKSTDVAAMNNNGGTYSLYINSFKKYCGVEDVAGSYKDILVFTPPNKTPEAKAFRQNNADHKPDSLVNLYEGGVISCKDLAGRLSDKNNGAVVGMATWIKNNPESTPTDASGSSSCTANPDDPSCKPGGSSCIIDGIGWMVCPVLNAFGGLADAMYGWIANVLIVSPLSMQKDDGSDTPQYTAWQSVRNIANVVLVIAFLLIIFSQLTGMGISNYGVKKTLPRLVIIALAINASFILMMLAVDLTNIIGTGIYSLFKTLTPGADSSTMNAGALVASLLAGTGAVTVAGTAITIAAISGSISLPVLALMALPVILGIVLALIAAVATLFIRNALVIVLIVISPLAIAAYLLPNTQQLFTKWRKLFISMLFLFPMAAMLFGGSKFAAHITVNGGDPMSALAAIFIMAVPLGMLPWLVRSSNSILGNVGNRLSGLAKKATNPARKAVQGQIDKQRASVLAGRRNMFGRRQSSNKTNVAQRWNNRKLSREQEIENLKGESHENWRELGLSGTGRAAERARHALDEQQTHHTRKAAIDSGYKLRSDQRKNTSGTEDHAYNVRAEDNAIKSGAISEQLRAAQSRRVLLNTNGVGTADTAGREAKLQTARNEALTQRNFDQHVQNSPSLTATQQATRIAQDESKTIQLEQDRAYEQLKSTDAGLLSMRDRQADAQLHINSITEKMAKDTLERQNTDPSLLNVRLDTEASKKERAVLEQQVAQMVTEGGSAKGGVNLVTDAGTAVTDPTLGLTTAQQAGIVSERQAIADRLQQAQTDTGIASSATAAAQRVQQGEFTEAVTNSSGPGSLAEQMAGIDDVHGEALVGAQAIETQRKTYESNVTAYSIQHRNQGVGSDSLLKFAQGSDPSNPTRALTLEEREAAGRSVVDSGNIDLIKDYSEYLATALDNASGNPQEVQAVKNLQKAFADKVGSSPGKPMGLGPVEIEQLRNGWYRQPQIALAAGGLLTASQMAATAPGEVLSTANGVQTFNTVVTKGVSAEGWASMDKSDIATIDRLALANVIPADRAKTMVDSIKTSLTDKRISTRIKEREQKYLRDLYIKLNGTSDGLPQNIKDLV